MVDLTSAGRVQGPGLNLTPVLQPGPVVSGVMVQPTNLQGAGSNLMGIADALSRLGAPLSQFGAVVNQNKIDQQSKETDLYVARIQAGFGTQATQSDINNVTSALHPKVRQRVTEDYMFNNGTTWAKSQLEGMPYDAMMTPEAEQAFYSKLRQDALTQAGSDPLKAAGFMRAVQSEIAQRGQQTSAQRTAEWTKIQSDAFGNSLSLEADKVAGIGLTPQLSDAITSTAQKNGASWLVPFLTRTAQIESGGGRNNLNPNSSATGPFQFTKGTGEAYGLTTSADRMDPYKSSDAAAKLAMDNFNTLKNGLGRDPTMGELYLAHQQGAGGALSLLKEPNGLAVKTLGMDAVKLNGGGPGMTNAQFADQWTKKFGNPEGGAMAVNTDMNSTDPILPPEALALRTYFFGKDSEYKVTGSLANSERRDIAAQTFMQKALQYRDERYLMAMPEELMTPDIRQKYLQVQEQIGNMKVQDLRDSEYQKELADKTTVRETTFDVINRRAAGEQIDPYQAALGPDGKIDPIKFAAAQAAVTASGNFISDVQSKRQAATFQDEMVNAFLKNDFSKIPMLQYTGDAPSKDDLRTAILLNPTMNDQEKIALYNSIDKDVLSTVSYLQNPMVDKFYNTYVSSTLEGMLKDPIISIKLTQFPNIRDQVREAFDVSLMTQIQTAGGVPVDQMKMLKAATEDARAIITNLTGTSTTSPPDPTVTPTGGHFEDIDGVRTWVPDN